MRASLSALLLAASLMAGCSAAPPPSPAAPVAVSAGACPPGTSDPLCAMSDEQLARKMIEVTGSANLGKRVADNLLDSLGKKRLPPAVIQRLRRNIRPEELTELVIPIYLKHYKRPTMIAAIRFYQSPEGNALIEELPAAADESMAAGREWGRRIAEKTLKEMAESGREQ